MLKQILLWTAALGCLWAPMTATTGPTVILPDIEKPRIMKVDDTQIYITEGSRIFIYNKKDGALLKKLGKSGNAPDQFKPTLMGAKRIGLSVQGKHMVITSEERISFFNKQGEFLENIKAPGQSRGYYQSGDYLVGMKYLFEGGNLNSTESVMVLKKTGKTFKGVAMCYTRRPGSGRDLMISLSKKQDYPVIRDAFVYRVTDDKIYVADTEKGFFIGIYDITGNKIREINKEYEKIKIPEIRKTQEMETFKKKKMWKYIEYINPVFPDHFPAMRTMTVHKGKIVAFTYARRGTDDQVKEEVLVLDEKGNLLTNKWVPPATLGDVYDDIYFYLIKNKDNEWTLNQWELKNNEIK